VREPRATPTGKALSRVRRRRRAVPPAVSASRFETKVNPEVRPWSESSPDLDRTPAPWFPLEAPARPRRRGRGPGSVAKRVDALVRTTGRGSRSGAPQVRRRGGIGLCEKCLTGPLFRMLTFVGLCGSGDAAFTRPAALWKALGTDTPLPPDGTPVPPRPGTCSAGDDRRTTSNAPPGPRPGHPLGFRPSDSASGAAQPADGQGGACGPLDHRRRPARDQQLSSRPRWIHAFERPPTMFPLAPVRSGPPDRCGTAPRPGPGAGVAGPLPGCAVPGALLTACRRHGGRGGRDTAPST